MKNKYEIRGDVVCIFLNRRKGNNLETLIDLADLDKVNKFPGTFYAAFSQTTDSYYATCQESLRNGKQRTVRLHRLLFDEPDNFIVDHIDHNTLDNRRSNLRLVDHSINMRNLKSAQKNNVYSDVVGVSWRKQTNSWIVRITVNGKRIQVGTTKSYDEAVKMSVQARSLYYPHNKSTIELPRDFSLSVYREVPRANKSVKSPKNIFYHKRDKKWDVAVTVNGKRKYIGRYSDLEDAKKALDDYKAQATPTP
jgi:extradiol dioxygenase family protein